MPFPDFFAHLPGITVYDPLAELLGSAAGGRIDYGFTDAVKLTGHACPTVAGAWLMTVGALRALYPDAIPERGAIAVAFGENLDSGVAGVMASVATLLTGAAGPGGFKGLGGHYARRDLLHFGITGVAGCRFRRLDTGAAVDCELDFSRIPADPRLGGWLGSLLDGSATPETRQQFADAWLDRVRRILLADPAPLRISAVA